MPSMLLINTFILILILLLLLFTSPNSGGVHGRGLKEERNSRGQRIVKGIRVMRKVLGNMEEAMLMDYHEPSANPSHEPRKGSPGGRP